MRRQRQSAMSRVQSRAAAELQSMRTAVSTALAQEIPARLVRAAVEDKRYVQRHLDPPSPTSPRRRRRSESPQKRPEVEDDAKKKEQKELDNSPISIERILCIHGYSEG